MDGAMGTLLQTRGLPFNTPSECWNITHPEEIKKVHEEYIQAGSRLIFTNTFCGTKEGIKKGIELALSVRNKMESFHNDAIFVAGNLGPGFHDESILKMFADSEIDLMVFETMTSCKEMDWLVTKMRQLKKSLPLMTMMTLSREGLLLSGETLKEGAHLLEKKGIDILGLNCGFGPEHLYSHFLKLKRLTNLPLAIKPNAGWSITHHPSPITPKIFAGWMKKYIMAGANLIGGCCGTTPEFIRLMVHFPLERVLSLCK